MTRFLSVVLLCSFTAFAEEGWKLVWRDEFNAKAGTLPDDSKWVYDIGRGGNGWGNNERQYYTNSPENVSHDGQGNLVITAKTDPTLQYTSARIKTSGKYAPKFGKIEMRAKLPFGQGIWPAFWMLGADIDQVSWPNSGEIDIMENIGREPRTVHGTLHGPGYSGSSPKSAQYNLPSGRFADDFHTYTIEWSENRIEWFVDGVSFFTMTPANLPSGTQWVFNKPFFLLLNLAVGGTWPGYPDATTTFPQTYTIDYVRVYQRAQTPAIHAGSVVNAASFGSALAPGALASVFGIGMSGETRDGIFDAARNAFPESSANVQVRVNGVFAPLTYVSADQVNFQIPWETPVGQPVSVEVVRSGTATQGETITLGPAAPSAFQHNGRVITTCTDGVCTIWGNAFGRTSPARQNGTPAPGAARTELTCRLTIEGRDAPVEYCGAAPTLVIDQLNFRWPAGVTGSGSVARATLAIGETSGDLLLPIT